MLARLSWLWVCCHSDITKSLLQAARVPRCWQLGSVWNESRREGGKISKHEWSQLQSLKQFHVSAHYLRLCVCPSGFEFITCASACARGLTLLPNVFQGNKSPPRSSSQFHQCVIFCIVFMKLVCCLSVWGVKCVPFCLFSSLLPDW